MTRRLCASAELADGGPGLRFEIPDKNGPQAAFAVRFRGQVYAYLNRCAHVGVELDWQPGEFFDSGKLYLICATHGALYAPESGRCRAGPCKGGSLRPVPVEERAGAIYLVE